MENIIFFVGFVYFFAHLLAVLFKTTKIPDVLILMISGVLVGPVIGWVHPSDFGKVGHVMTTMALILILFESGLTLDISSLIKSWRTTIIFSLSVYFTSMTCVTLIAYFLFHLSLLSAATLGSILSGVSAVVVIPMVKGLRMGEPAAGMMVIESALTDVLCIVLALALVNAGKSGDGGVHAGHLIGGLLSSLAFAALIGVAGGAAWLFLLKIVRRFPDTIFTTLAFLFILYGIAEFLGFSGGIAALSFGLTLANQKLAVEKSSILAQLKFLKRHSFSQLNKMEHGFFREVIFILKIFFFVYLGTSISFQQPVIWFWGLLLVAVIYLSRILILKPILKNTVAGTEASIMSIMTPKGVAAVALAAIPLESGMSGGELIQPIVYTVVFMTITATAAGVPLIHKTFVGNLFNRWFTDPNLRLAKASKYRKK